MENINNLKVITLSILGIVGSYLAALLGGWDIPLGTLITFMAIDYITGLVVAGVFKKSSKTESGALQSQAGWKGLCRKGMTLLIVLVAFRLDLIIGSNFIRNTVVIAYIVNEALSITENAGLMGLPIPDALKKGIDALTNKNQSKQE